MATIISCPRCFQAARSLSTDAGGDHTFAGFKAASEVTCSQAPLFATRAMIGQIRSGGAHRIVPISWSCFLPLMLPQGVSRSLDPVIGRFCTKLYRLLVVLGVSLRPLPTTPNHDMIWFGANRVLGSSTHYKSRTITTLNCPTVSDLIEP